MNLLAIIVILLAIATSAAIIYIAWEMTSETPDDDEVEPEAPEESRKTPMP